ncbi:hypothetical protein OIE66_04720 [Nonomuraea sp. NBC_01738]|uniref:hypothetical protein n=1 Tax=Nonomuraea sp. NBC_01738 TaxID=2976003 RepID=UPI002E1642DF|nr:hypothetical protein OIE66_04720 [Nonomuraea sp. NBC_01738]
MGLLRMIVAYSLAAVSVAAVVWCTVNAYRVDPPPRRPTLDDTVSLPSARPVPERRVDTEITVARATGNDLRGVPSSRIDERRRQVLVTIVHRIRMDDEDVLAAWIRRGADFPRGIRTVTDGLGPIKVGGAVLIQAVRQAPLLTTSGGSTTAEFRIVLLRQVGGDEELTIDILRPAAKPPLTLQRTVTVFPTEWRVLRTAGISPEREEPERLQFTINYPVSLALVHDGQGFPDQETAQNFSWETALAIVTALVMIFFLCRSLGLAWWRRLPNLELVTALALAVPVLVIPLFARDLLPFSYVILFGALPALALRHATRVVPTAAPWTTRDALAVTGAAVLVAFGMLAWSGCSTSSR